MAQAILSNRHQAGSTAAVLRVGLVGCGERGVALCSELRRTANARLTLAMDANPALAQDVGRRFDVPSTTDLDAVLSSDQVDAVIIATPHHLHAPQAIAAARAGKHVMVEKPLATRFAEAVDVVREARRAGIRLSTILPYRYQPPVVQARELVRAGAVGELFGVSLTFHDDRFVDYWRGGYTARTTSDWRLRWETSGGGLFITSIIHQADWLRFVPQVEVVEIAAHYATFDSPGEVEDTLTMSMRYENGALGTVSASSCVRGTDLMEFRLWGRDGHVSIGTPPQFYSLKVVDGNRPGRWHRFNGVAGLKHRDIEYLQRFAASVLAGEEPEITDEDGLAAQAIVEAAYESARTGRAVQVARRPWGLEGVRDG